MKSKNKTLALFLSIGMIVALIGVSYAFFGYGKAGVYTHTINGGKMNVIYDEITSNNIVIDNAYPLTDEEALEKAMEFEFTITGYNESDKNIYYAIEMAHGEDKTGKNRFKDSDMKISLFENDELVFENQIFDNLDNQGIYYGYINYGTSKDTPVVKNYLLRMWINDNVFITNTSDEYDTEGKSVYSTEEFANSYGNFKVNVVANLTGEDIGMLWYDANGGEFTPEATSLTLNRVTMQKPVMAEKCFLGWSSDKNATTPEYYAGDDYFGEGQMLYAIYGDIRNVMGKIPSEISNGRTMIKEVIFINATEETINNRVNNSIVSVDLTLDNQGKVIGWVEEDTDNDLIFYIGSEGTTYLTDCQGMFADWTSLENIDFSNVDTIMVTDMSYMFSSLTIMEENGITQVKNDKGLNSFWIKQLFVDPIELPSLALMNSIESLNLEAFNTSNVTTMKHMFGGKILDTTYCSKYQEINLNTFDTSNVIDMSYMFSWSDGLLRLDVSNFDTSSVVNMESMFADCRNIIELNVENFNTSKVTNMNSMFSFCEKLHKLEIDHFDTSKVTDMSYMFYRCEKVEELLLNNFDTSLVENMEKLFGYCYTLKKVELTNFNTMNVVNMEEMFFVCNNLISLDLSSFNTTQVTNMSSMFDECNSLTTLDLSNFDITNVTNMSNMFGYVGSDLDEGFYTTIYVKSNVEQSWILGLSDWDRPSGWSTSNVIVKIT